MMVPDPSSMRGQPQISQIAQILVADCNDFRQGHARSGGGDFGHMALKTGFSGADAPRVARANCSTLSEVNA